MTGPFSSPGITPSMVYGTTAQSRVVDTMDPLEQGRVRIRLAGQDSIPVDQLPWVSIQGPPFSGVGAHGESAGQLLIGQYVQAQLDQYNQIMHVSGNVPAPAAGGDGPGTNKDTSTGIPQASRQKTTPKQHVAPNPKNFITEATGALTMASGIFEGTGIKIQFDELQHIAQTLTKNNGQAKHNTKPTSAPDIQQLFDAIKHIKNFDPSNLSGAIQPALDAMQNLLKGGGAGGANPFQSMQSMMGSAFGDFAAAAQQAGQVANNSAIGSPCLLENLITGETANGTVQVISGNVVCQPLVPTANTANMVWVPEFIQPQIPSTFIGS